MDSCENYRIGPHLFLFCLLSSQVSLIVKVVAVYYDLGMNKRILLTFLVAILILLSSCAYPETKFFNDHIIDMWAQTLQPYSVDIAFYGDSRVALANWEEAYPASELVNLGIGGDIVEGTIQRLRLLQALDVKHCFLAIGVNNCSNDNFSEAGFRNSYTLLLDGLEDLGITVYVNTIAGVTTAN